MKDLDFDELDRAVNSLMTDTSKTQPSTPKAEPDEQEKTLDIMPTLGDTTPPSFDKLNEATAKTTGALGTTSDADKKTEETSVPVTGSHASSPSSPPAGSGTPPAAKRGGRFMDVVHPSTNTKKADASARVSRQGVTIAPISTPKVEPEPPTAQESQTPASSADTSQPKPVDPSVEKPTPLAVPSRPPVETHGAAKSDWPDPLDMAGFEDDKEKDRPAEGTPPVKDAAKEPDADVTPSDAQASDQGKKEEGGDQPLVSPFLTDAKVEKRPLGGGTVSGEAEEPGHAPVLGAASEEKKSINDPAAQLPASPEAVEPELPEELQGDLVAIESDTTTHPQLAPVDAAPVADEKKEAGASAAEEDQTFKSSPSGRDQEERLVPSGPTSIPQQYREEASTGDKDSGAIYDTSTYHQPLAHPEKKKSGWLVVVWVLVILLLGAGGGAALYLLGVV